MKHGLIENGVVVDISLVDPRSIFLDGYAKQFVEIPDDVTLGMLYDGETFSAAQELHQPPELRTCTPAQGLVALFAVKQITEDDVHAGIAAISDPVERYTAQIGFKRATEWQEDSPTMQLVQAMLQLSAQDMRELFDYAQTVRV